MKSGNRFLMRRLASLILLAALIFGLGVGLSGTADASGRQSRGKTVDQPKSGGSSSSGSASRNRPRTLRRAETGVRVLRSEAVQDRMTTRNFEPRNGGRSYRVIVGYHSLGYDAAFLRTENPDAIRVGGTPPRTEQVDRAITAEVLAAMAVAADMTDEIDGNATRAAGSQLLRNNQQLINQGFLLYPDSDQLDALTRMVNNPMGYKGLKQEAQNAIQGYLASNEAAHSQARELLQVQAGRSRLAVVNFEANRSSVGAFWRPRPARVLTEAEAAAERYGKAPTEPIYSPPPVVGDGNAPENQYDDLPDELADALGVPRSSDWRDEDDDDEESSEAPPSPPEDDDEEESSDRPPAPDEFEEEEK